MLRWSQIAAFLKSVVIRKMAKPAKGTVWLKRLPLSEDGERLGVCIAIDILSQSLPAEVFAEIIDHVNLAAGDSRQAFAGALETLVEDKFNCPSRFRTEPETEDANYIRIIDLVSFITYYIAPTYIEPFNPSKLRYYEKKFFADQLELKLGEIDRWWSGKRARVWVLARSEFEQLSKYAKDKSEPLASILIDALGFGEPSRIDSNVPELLAVIYPHRIPVHTAQPTTVDADWRSQGGFYLSYRGDDKWGRTHSSSGRFHPVKERVHPKFEGLTDDYVAIRIGIPNSPTIDRDTLLKAAYKRAEAVWQGSSTHAKTRRKGTR